ncbi:MAG TPA: hypothetical protein VNP04_13625 [Alphaproteobacteria bacterium]|nr:hypothetical protein [Alphaproteobacteria bacterium]
MTYGSNAAITRTIKMYPTVSGSSMLLEYRGSHFDVVAFDIEAFRPTPALFINMNLNAVKGMSLSSVSMTAFQAAIESWRIQPTVVRYCNINGIAHVIVPTQGLLPHDVVRCSAVVIG